MSRPTYTEPPRANPLGTASSGDCVPCPEGCGAWLVFTPDAIGRLRSRCPKCDGVAPARRPRPGEIRRPQTITEGAAFGPMRVEVRYELPPIEPGQLRCQRCARGVDGRRRVCRECANLNMKEGNARRRRPKPLTGTHDQRIYKPKRCRRCAREFAPSGPRSLECRRPDCLKGAPR